MGHQAALFTLEISTDMGNGQDMSKLESIVVSHPQVVAE
jgi:hypothetical protein